MKEKVLTRKKTVLRRLGLLLSVMLLASSLSGYNFAPRMAVSEIADQEDMKYYKTFITSFPGDTVLKRNYLVETEEALLFSTVGWTPYGWMAYEWGKIEAWDDAPLHAGMMSKYTEKGNTHWLYGRVAERPDNLWFYYEVKEGLHTSRFGVSVPEEDIFQGENGAWYFITAIEDRHFDRERQGADGEFRLNAVKGSEKLAGVPVWRQSWHGR
ncbi:MAG: hypothetical protein IJE22_02545 [Oscillibacter sp.]|nr:hypothetical protein [Oscillibacter sp.]MBQ2996098.1 hypothetical protein [Oscillibacter sp.]